MFELIVQGGKPHDRWRRKLPPDTTLDIGRATPWSVPWDKKVSRKHFTIELKGKTLIVRKLEEASNPIFFKGRKVPSCGIRPGEHFVVGDTTFAFSDERAFVSQDARNPISQKTFSPEFLQQVQYRDADRRIDVLSRLPEVVAGTGDEKDLMTRLVNILLSGLSSATGVAMVKCSTEATEILHWDRQLMDQGDFQPSEGLIRQAIEGGETVLHVWNRGPGKTPDRDSDFTVDYENDWAYVCPLSGEVCQGWGIYVAGRDRSDPRDADSGQPDVQGDIKFTELVGSTLANVLQLQKLERRQSSLRNFFSPLVLQAFANKDPEEVLAPRQCEVSVLFCDLRGFSKRSEELSSDLIELLSRVSHALGIMTRIVMDLDGVVGDFHGDAAMGFWGWPFEQENTAEQACLAAIQIQSELGNVNIGETGSLGGFKMGIGIATGVAVAGKIGTSDQVKVTAFGPVVNLAARLEGMTRIVGSNILLDGATASKLESSDETPARLLLNVRPYGLKSTTEVHRLITPGNELSKEHLAAYEQALSSFYQSDWKAAAEKLEPLAQVDDAATFLLRQIKGTDLQPPADWDGVISLDSK